MLLGLGNDIVSVKRIKNSYKRFGKRLENKIYTTAEIKLIWERGSPCFKTLSSRWAAKEAFVKALGTGFRKGIFWKDISVLNNLNGKPELVIRGQAKVCLNSIIPADKSPIIHISISDEKEIVNAIVIIEARDLNHLQLYREL